MSTVSHASPAEAADAIQKLVSAMPADTQRAVYDRLQRTDEETSGRSADDKKTAMLGLNFARAEAGGTAVAFLGSHIAQLNDALSAAGIVLRHIADEIEDQDDCAEFAGALRSTVQGLYAWWQEADERVRAMRDGSFASVPILAGQEFILAMEARNAGKAAATAEGAP